MRPIVPLALCVLAMPPALADTAKKPMEVDRPMTTKMMKPGMKQRDVKREADRKAREMKPELRREEKSMGKGG